MWKIKSPRPIIVKNRPSPHKYRNKFMPSKVNKKPNHPFEIIINLLILASANSIPNKTSIKKTKINLKF